MEYIDCRLVALSKRQIKGTNAVFSNWFEVIQTSTDFDNPTIAKSEIKVQF